MKKKTVWILIVLVVIVVGGILVKKAVSKSDAVTYEYATVARGNIVNTISASGTLSPVTTVDVGTQVSGTIDSVYVDFNDNVRQGQVLAVLDTVLLKTNVIDAEANLERADAALSQAKADFDRADQLYAKKLISDADYITAQVNIKTQEAAVKSAQADVTRAHRNLQYAVIKSPINGTVISKNVESGQTVASSFSTPTLFKIAEDLSHMQILADVDEGDIGQIKNGQAVTFQVQAYPDKQFTGTVNQLRLEPTTVQNVVTYTVVVDAVNPDNLLLPGMTATIDFIVDQKTDVLLIPNKALRFQPTEEQLVAYRERRQKELANMPDSVKAAFRGGSARNGAGSGGNGGGQQAGMMVGGGGAGSGQNHASDFGRVWYLDDNNQLAMAPFKIGATDGTNTEVVSSRVLNDGMKIIVGTQSSATQTAERPMGFRMFR